MGVKEVELHPRVASGEFIHTPEIFDIRQAGLAYINRCAQYRGTANPIQDTLNDSIQGSYMFYPLLVAELDHQTTENYIEFTNRAWKGNVSIEDFKPSPHMPGHYLILIDGHSRLTSLEETARIENIDPSNFGVNIRVLHDVATVDEIIEKQTQANIYASPAPQNLAMAVAQAWLWAKEKTVANGERLSKRDFVRRHRIGEQALRDGLFYIELPIEIRDLCNNGHLPFSIAVELGRGVSTLHEYAKRVAPKEPATLFKTEMLRLAYRYIEHGQVLQARAHIRATVQSMKDVINAGDAPQQSFDSFFRLEQEETRLERAQRELRELLKHGQERISTSQVSLHNAIVAVARQEEFAVDPGQFDQLHAQALQKLGQVPLSQTVPRL